MQPELVDESFDFAKLPVLTKDNTFGRFSIDELAVTLPVAELADVLTSSGRGGRTFGFKLATRKQYAAAAWSVDLGLQEAFDVDNKRTLLVNCLPMGIFLQSGAATVANVSVREDMAVAILKALGPKFDQVVVCTDPLFVRQILDEAHRCRLNWPTLRASMILGEESLVESQRDYIARELGIDPDRDASRLIGSSFGVGELGLNLLFETHESILLRRSARQKSSLRDLLLGSNYSGELPSIFCYNPLRCHVEVIEPNPQGFGKLCFTLNEPDAIVPLPRYTTGDWGRLIDSGDLSMLGECTDLILPWLPMVMVCGRVADRLEGLPNVEEVKEAIYSIPWLADEVTGAFRIGRDKHGKCSLELQGKIPQSPDWVARAESLLRNAFRPHNRPTEVRIVSADKFRGGGILDYEKKFNYFAQ